MGGTGGLLEGCRVLERTPQFLSHMEGNMRWVGMPVRAAIALAVWIVLGPWVFVICCMEPECDGSGNGFIPRHMWRDWVWRFKE